MYKNWHNIDSKVQLAGDWSEMPRGTHSATMTPIVVVIADRVVIADPGNSAMQQRYSL